MIAVRRTVGVQGEGGDPAPHWVMDGKTEDEVARLPLRVLQRNGASLGQGNCPWADVGLLRDRHPVHLARSVAPKMRGDGEAGKNPNWGRDTHLVITALASPGSRREGTSRPR